MLHNNFGGFLSHRSESYLRPVCQLQVTVTLFELQELCAYLPNNILSNLLHTPAITCWLGIQSTVKSAVEHCIALPRGQSSAYLDVRYIHAVKCFIRF